MTESCWSFNIVKPVWKSMTSRTGLFRKNGTIFSFWFSFLWCWYSHTAHGANYVWIHSIINDVVRLMQHLHSWATDCRRSLHSWSSCVMTHKADGLWLSTTSSRRVFSSSRWLIHSARRTRACPAWYRSAMKSSLQWFCATNHSTQCVLYISATVPFASYFVFCVK